MYRTVKYHEQYPLYFSFTLSEINVDLITVILIRWKGDLPGREQIIEIIASFIREGWRPGLSARSAGSGNCFYSGQLSGLVPGCLKQTVLS